MSKDGILPDFMIHDMIEEDKLSNVFIDSIQPASIDVGIGSEMETIHEIESSYLPGYIKLDPIRILKKPFLLRKGIVYELQANLNLRLDEDIEAVANPKSTSGRLGIFTRLVTDNAKKFDYIPAGYRGKVSLQICSTMFNIQVNHGDCFMQLRFRIGKKKIHKTQDLVLQLGSGIVAWKAKNTDKQIVYREFGHSIMDYWNPMLDTDHLIVKPGELYIVSSHESIEIDPSECADMVTFDPQLGEFRNNYAGFFDPGFGWQVDDTRAVFEIKSRELPFVLTHNQVAGKLLYEKMLEIPRINYGKSNNYQGQKLRLAKQFYPRGNSIL